MRPRAHLRPRARLRPRAYLRTALPFTLAVTAALTLTACGTSSQAGADQAATGGQTPAAPSGTTDPGATQGARTTYPVTLDNCGTKVTFEAAPDRVVTIKSTTTEMLLSLGLGDKIVGTAYLDGPVPDALAQAAQGNAAIQKPLSDKVPGSEAVLATQPDLVYAGWESNVTAEGAGDRATLAKLGVNTYVSPSACQEKGYQPDPLTFDDVFGEIDEVGKIFDAQGAAATLVADQKKELAAITPSGDGHSALWWSSGTDTPYVGAGIGAPALVLKTAGLTNVAGDQHATWAPMSWESIVAADPDVIVLVDSTWNSAQHKIDYLESNGATKNLTAVREKRFVTVPFAASEAGVRTVDAARSVSEQVAALDLP